MSTEDTIRKLAPVEGMAFLARKLDELPMQTHHAVPSQSVSDSIRTLRVDELAEANGVAEETLVKKLKKAGIRISKPGKFRLIQESEWLKALETLEG